jgi:5-formyltetrahydrofolate cyclo-ligase
MVHDLLGKPVSTFTDHALGWRRKTRMPGRAPDTTEHVLNSTSQTIEGTKAQLRAALQVRRDALPADDRRAAAQTIAARAFPLPIAQGTIVSGFMPLKSEINPLPLMQRLADAGASLALPVIAGRGKPLIMRAWRWGEPLNAGVWGIREPKPGAPEVDPDILLVPLLAFDRSGQRIGYGAGYYDMTIARLRARKTITAIGIAFAAQEVAAVPTTAFDAPLDLVLTEREVIELRDA